MALQAIGGLDEFPELGDFLQHFVLGHGELGAEEDCDETGLLALNDELIPARFARPGNK